MRKSAVLRSVCLFLLLVVAALYALPNWFGEDPAIQISWQNGQTVTEQVVESMRAALLSERIKVRKISRVGEQSVLLRFSETRQQLEARSIIQKKLGEEAIVALNLAPRTPHWLAVLGAHPMRLGLDLRGGVHFLLQVDVGFFVQEQLSSDVASMTKALQEHDYLRTAIVPQAEGFTVRFDRAETRDAAVGLLEKQWPAYQYITDTAADTYSIAGKLRTSALWELKHRAVESNIEVLRHRVDALGVAEPVIQQEGADEISVDLPGMQDTARAKSIIGKVATVTLHLQDISQTALSWNPADKIPQDRLLEQYSGRLILLDKQSLLKGEAIQSARAGFDDTGRPAVFVGLRSEAIPAFNQATGTHVGHPLATLYVETRTEPAWEAGKRVYKAHVVRKIINIATIASALGGQFQITGLQTITEAQNLALLLRSGAYTAPVTFLQEDVLGPSLGRENIQKGMLSCVVAALAVMLFMLVYYRLFGIIANVALCANVLFLVAIMSLLGATLTLPGIAGIVLTVGMAVDANVLINERIREELRLGTAAKRAIELGYKRAFSTIIDANITTFFVGLILYGLGSSSVQGFAITLMIGLATSCFTAIFLTRTIVERIYARRHIPRLSIGIAMDS